MLYHWLRDFVFFSLPDWVKKFEDAVAEDPYREQALIAMEILCEGIKIDDSKTLQETIGERKIRLYANCASPSSGNVYGDWQLTLNFELWVEIFRLPICFQFSIWGFRNCVCPYLRKDPSCPYPSFVNISLTVVIDSNYCMSSQVRQHENPKIWFFF